MTTQEAIKEFGGATKLARSLSITRDAVYKWGEYPPNETQYKIMMLSGGRLSVTFISNKDNKKDE